MDLEKIFIKYVMQKNLSIIVKIMKKQYSKFNLNRVEKLLVILKIIFKIIVLFIAVNLLIEQLNLLFFYYLEQIIGFTLRFNYYKFLYTY